MQYYSDSEKNEIRQIFGAFIYAIQTHNVNALSEVLHENVTANYSTMGSISGAENVAQSIIWQGRPINISNHTICNYVCRHDNGKAQDFACVLTFLAHDNGLRLFPLLYGGMYCNTYIKTASGWKISEIKYDLVYVSGNTSWVKDWTLIDYKIYAGHPPAINSLFDSPWRVIPKVEYAMTDREKIEEVFFHYAYSVDLGNLDELINICDPNINMYARQKSNYGVRQYTDFIKHIHHKEPAMYHTVKIRSIEIDGNKATLIGDRIEPNRLGTRNLTHSNYNKNFFTTTYYTKFEKRNDDWMISEFQFGYSEYENEWRDDSCFIDADLRLI